MENQTPKKKSNGRSSALLGVITSDASYQKINRFKYMVIILIAFILIYRVISPNLQNRITMDISYAGYLDRTYTEVEESLQKQGFADIKTKVIRDLSVGEGDKVKLVAGVSIGGDMTFQFGQKFSNSTEVMIYYHDYIQIPIPEDYQDLRLKNYMEVRDILAQGGFTQIECRADYDLITTWLDQPDSVKSIEINGDTYFRKGDLYNPDVPIVITHHQKVQ